MSTMRSDAELLCDLIGFDTTSARSNRAMSEFVASYVDGPGRRIERISSPCGSKENLLVQVGPESDSGDGLILSGHMDVVPAEEPEWTGDPFVARRESDRILGRGACDMKASVAIFANMMRSVDPDRLRAPLAMLLSYDEEIGGVGAADFAKSWDRSRPLPRNVLIGEPTSLRAVHLHKGHLKVAITITGRSAHSGAPQLGINAIAPAGGLIAAIEGYAAELREVESPYGEFFADAAPYPVMSVVMIDGGTALNIVPESCTLTLSIRLLPGMSSSVVLERLQAIVDDVGAGTEASMAMRIINDNPPLLGDVDSALYRLLTAAVGQTEPLAASFASDGGPLQEALGMNAILFGPGSINVAHKPDEWVPLDELERASLIMRDVATDFCGRDGDSVFVTG